MNIQAEPKSPTLYCESVLDYLEFLGYDKLIAEFDELDVAQSMIESIGIFYAARFSYRMCALVIYGLTWQYQILPRLSNATKH